MVNRINKGALLKILSGKVKRPCSIVFKFYSNGCHYCHALKEDYSALSEMYDDLLFFAFNINDYPELPKILNFEGVPTLMIVNYDGKKVVNKFITEPENPDKTKWYSLNHMKSFVDRERM
jgi:thiol-disulfide isomerase/thioredoxin